MLLPVIGAEVPSTGRIGIAGRLVAPVSDWRNRRTKTGAAFGCGIGMSNMLERRTERTIA